jgi:hypothetical protein
VRAKLKSLSSTTVDDLENWSSNGDSFGVVLDAMIGPSESEGAELFSITVCTPDWFAANRMNGSAVTSGIHTLFVAQYDYRALRAFIERAVYRTEADTWSGVAERLSWLGSWEFFDYTP